MRGIFMPAGTASTRIYTRDSERCNLLNSDILSELLEFIMQLFINRLFSYLWRWGIPSCQIVMVSHRDDCIYTNINLQIRVLEGNARLLLCRPVWSHNEFYVDRVLINPATPAILSCLAIYATVV